VRIFSSLFGAATVAVAFASVATFGGTAGATTSTAAPFAAEPINCVAEYEESDKPKVAGEPTELVLKSYSCGDDVSTMTWVFFKAWEHEQYIASSVEFKLPNGSECDIDGYRWDVMPSGWDNRITSFRAYGSCQGVRLYDNTHTSGTCGSYEGDTSNVGVDMNDKTSSFRSASGKKNC
jgi:hypothetical protein